MANSYSQIDIHLVFAVKFRNALIRKDGKENLHKFITGVIAKNDCKLIAINSMPDHIHILFGLHPKISLSDLVRDIKANSSAYMKNENDTPNFTWQEGFGAFAHSRSQRSTVISYIQNQEEHHRIKSFREEYIEFLKSNNINYDERYVFVDPV